MDRKIDGISCRYTTSGNYIQSDNYADASRGGRYRHSTVRQQNSLLPNILRRNERYHTSDACSSGYTPRHSVKPVYDFNALLTQDKIDFLVRMSAGYDVHYKGRTHSEFAISIKQYTIALKRPLDHREQCQLMPLLHAFKAAHGWTWRNLTTTIHSFTSAGVLTPDKYMDEGSKQNQAALLLALFDAVIFKCNQKTETRYIDSQGITNLLWSVAKLVDNGLKLEKAPIKETVTALLPHVKTKAESNLFSTQGTANLMWAVVILVDNGLELEKNLNETMVVLLTHVKTKADSKEEKVHFMPQHIANLIWAVAKLGEAIELDLVRSTYHSLVDRIRENHQFSRQHISMSLWGVMVFCARCNLYYGNDNKNPLEKHIGELSYRLENTSTRNPADQSMIAMAASWLGKACPVVPDYLSTISQSQFNFRDQLQSSIPSLKIEEEKSLNSLPPVDLLLPDYNIIIDIQGPSHYVNGDYKTMNGSTLLKIALLQKSGFEVIAIPVYK